MRLVGLARLDQRRRRERRRRLGRRRWPRSTGSGRTARPSREFSGRWSRLPTRNAPPRAPDPLAAPEGEDRRRARTSAGAPSGPSTGRPSGCSPNAARSIRCSASTDGWSCARAISWITTPRSRSSSSASIFGRPTKSVSRSIASGGDLGAAGDVERDEIVRRVGVQHRAHRLRGLVDLAVVVVLLAALEHEMLQEMGHPVLLGALGARAGVERDEHGGGAGRQLDAVQRQAVRQGGGLDARHGR